MMSGRPQHETGHPNALQHPNGRFECLCAVFSGRSQREFAAGYGGHDSSARVFFPPSVFLPIFHRHSLISFAPSLWVVCVVARREYPIILPPYQNSYEEMILPRVKPSGPHERRFLCTPLLASSPYSVSSPREDFPPEFFTIPKNL